ncbi:MAG: hypothetical protein ACR2OZ_12430, partial [Verrucomicrobiales bacterium]
MKQSPHVDLVMPPQLIEGPPGSAHSNSGKKKSHQSWGIKTALAIVILALIPHLSRGVIVN